MSPIVLFEPRDLTAYGPLTLMRPLAELQSGIYSNVRRCQLLYPGRLKGMWIRPALAELCIEEHPDLGINQTIARNSLLLHASLPAHLYKPLMESFDSVDEAVFMFNDQVLAAKVNRTLQFKPEELDSLSELPQLELPHDFPESIPEWIWDHLDWAPRLLEHDLQKWVEENVVLESFPGHLSTIAEEGIRLHQNARVSNYVHLDASNGPIVVDADAQILPFSSIQGPTYIGKRCQVRSHSSIRGSIVGTGSNVGGEIMHAHSNKVHDGYLGDSILGSWVNLGADTISSNLKNNYSPIRVAWEGIFFDTRRLFLGSIIGDHTKTAIGTRLNTGSMIGVFCNVFQTGFPPRSLPSFSWGDGTYQIEKALETAKRVLGRRNRELTAATESVIRALAHDPAPFIRW